MPLISLRGVAVDFPFPPYPCQEYYMRKVIECLQDKVNGVLESPTGTGKTLCLLCATLAWRDHFKDSISARKIVERMGGAELFPDRPMSSWGTSATDGDTPAYYTDIPKIIYASRTHSQLTQVINELKNTSYRPRVCVLGSREQLCINPDVMKQESNHIKVHMCRAKISSHSCIFYNNVEEKCTDKELANTILDVEDLVKAGNKQRVCPYYLTRSLKQQADIIFMPYNYLLDAKSRRAHSIELKGAVVIFDEAHNVEKMCEESSSFDLTPFDLASAIETVDKVLVEQAREVGRGDVTVDFNVESLDSELKLNITTIAKIKQILLDLEAVIDSFEVTSEKGITKPGSFIYELFQKAQLTFHTKADILEAMEQIIGNLAGRPGIFLNTSGLQKLVDIIQARDLVFVHVFILNGLFLYINHFQVHIHKDTSSHKRKNADIWASSSSKKQGNILSYWCFCPGFGMQELVHQGVRCIILTSGTLAPLSSFTSEMQIRFQVRLENPHVIQQDQIFVTIVEKGPDSVQLSSAFDRRFDPENMASLGNTVVNLARVIPHGLLVFFPSYPVMDKTIEFWRANGHADRIESIKPMFVEPKGKGTFTEIIDGYYDKVNDTKSKGGSFFAVCRGKASEGLDFADTFARGVIITGLPFPPRMDPRVILKMQYLDEMCKKGTKCMKYLSGREWYRQQASRAVNQAIGRVIRHRDDYGAIFLCDHRFKSSDARAQLPSWVRPYVRINDTFGNVVRDVAQFFRVAQKLRPPIRKNLPATGHGTVFSGAPSGPIPPSSPTHSTSLQKAKALDSHVPSLKKRRLSEWEGTARLCVQYEAQMQAGRRCPVGLLDALDNSDRRAVGEEDRFSTLSLQHDKRLDDESRRGKRKIKVVYDRADKARAFLGVIKDTLSQLNFQKVMEALQQYKKTDDLQALLTDIVDVFAKDSNTHNLLRDFYQFVRPHHKKEFDAACLKLTGTGCGYKPEHSLAKEERDKLMSRSGDCFSLACDQLNAVSQLNRGGSHLTTRGLSKGGHKQAPCQSSQKRSFYSAFLSDVKKAIGVEKSNQLFSALQNYKNTDNYENMVSTVVSLLTEKSEDFRFIKTFAMFVRPHHKRQFLELFKDLAGTTIPEEDVKADPAITVEGKIKSQSKISSFFSCSQRK
uniref:Regulator of telomere elongation helicase 1 n=1 Tax=Paramormyrops kingsleyae TaxID=1676925 RepID=A0A3B3SL80_9TELE